MNNFKLGIMSSTWTVEAPNVDVAVIALRLWGQYSEIPIVNYSSDEQSRFTNLLGATKKTAEIVGEFIKSNSEDIKKAVATIKEQS